MSKEKLSPEMQEALRLCEDLWQHHLQRMESLNTLAYRACNLDNPATDTDEGRRLFDEIQEAIMAVMNTQKAILTARFEDKSGAIDRFFDAKVTPHLPESRFRN